MKMVLPFYDVERFETSPYEEEAGRPIVNEACSSFPQRQRTQFPLFSPNGKMAVLSSRTSYFSLLLFPPLPPLPGVLSTLLSSPSFKMVDNTPAGLRFSLRQVV